MPPRLLANPPVDHAKLAAKFGAVYVDGAFIFLPSQPRPPEAPLVNRVYFVGGNVGHIKIGFSIDPEMRLLAIQTGSPIKLRIMATVAGERSLEREYHRRFAQHRAHGEWFERHPDILAEIERLSR